MRFLAGVATYIVVSRIGHLIINRKLIAENNTTFTKFINS